MKGPYIYETPSAPVIETGGGPDFNQILVSRDREAGSSERRGDVGADGGRVAAKGLVHITPPPGRRHRQERRGGDGAFLIQSVEEMQLNYIFKIPLGGRSG